MWGVFSGYTDIIDLRETIQIENYDEDAWTW